MIPTSPDADDPAAGPNFERQASTVLPPQRPDLRGVCCSLVAALGQRELGLFYARLDAGLGFLQTNPVLDRILDAPGASGFHGHSLRHHLESAEDFRTLEHARKSFLADDITSVVVKALAIPGWAGNRTR